MFETIERIGDKFVSAIMKDIKITNELEISEWSARFTTDVIGNIAFGIDCNCIDNPETEFRKHGRNVFRVDTPFSAIKMLFVNSFQSFSRYMGLMINEKKSSEFYLKIFSETIKHREESGDDRNDFIKLLLQMKKNGTLAFNEMAAESFIFNFAGFHTSASLMNFVLYELAVNRDIQTKLRNEIDKKLSENNGQLFYETVTEMKYLDMVVNEGLRKYPPINVLTRKCTKEYNVPGTNLTIPKGTQCTIPVYSIHRDEKYYPQPDVFDPERFNSENTANRIPFTFLPFGKPYYFVIVMNKCKMQIVSGEGPRICIGLRFALMTSKLALIKLLKEFEFDIFEKTLFPMKYSVKSLVLAPHNDELFLRVQKREY